jgi:hypothetical protein
VFAWKASDADAMRGGDQNSEEAQSMDNEEAAAIRSIAYPLRTGQPQAKRS